MKKARSAILSLLICLLAIVGTSSNVIAQSTNTNAAQGLQVSPTRVEINQINPGEARTFTVTVMNVTSSDLTYGTRVADFSANDETGSPSLSYLNDTDSSISMSSWITGLPVSLSLKARESKEIPVQVNVPSNAELGGHYGAILFPGIETDINSSGVGLSASTGVLVLVSVGDTSKITEEAGLKEFYTAHNDKQTGFFEASPIDFVVRIENTGNVHVKPAGSIEVSDIFGNVVDKIDVNSNQNSNVLPDSIRKFVVRMEKLWLFGRYTANLA